LHISSRTEVKIEFLMISLTRQSDGDSTRMTAKIEVMFLTDIPKIS
jgi:hypothetical protein